MPEVKFLEMCITENLSWQAQICSLFHRLSKTFFIINSVKNILSSHVLWNIYFAYFHLWLRYGIIHGGGGQNKAQKYFVFKKRWLD